MFEERHTHCIFTDDFELDRAGIRDGYCSFCKEQGNLVLVQANEFYPAALKHIEAGLPKVLCRDGQIRRLSNVGKASVIPVKASVKVDYVTVSGFVYWSDSNKCLMFRANPQRANYRLLPEPAFGYNKPVYGADGMFLEWSIDEAYAEHIAMLEIANLGTESVRNS